MTNLEYISSKSIIETYTLKTGNSDITAQSILHLTNDAIEELLPGEALLHHIVLLNIDNYKVKLPSNLKFILQAAYRFGEDLNEDELYTKFGDKIFEHDDINLKVKCNSCDSKVLQLDTDYDDIAKYPNRYANYSKFMYSYRGTNMNNCTLDDRFHLMRRTTNYFYNIPYHVNNCINLNVDSKVEYNIENGYLITNFQKGQVLIAFLGTMLDDEGYLMIPSHPFVYNAIVSNIESTLAYIEYRKDKSQQNRMFWEQTLQMKSKDNKKATSYLSTPSPDEFEMFLKNHWSRHIPNKSYESNHNAFVGDKRVARRNLIGSF